MHWRTSNGLRDESKDPRLDGTDISASEVHYSGAIKGPNAPSGAYTAVIAVYEVGKVDAANFKAFCEKDYNEKGFLFCSGFGEDFNFNRQTLRFVHWFPYGYIDPPGFDLWGKEGDATPFMEIGTCTAI